MGGGKKSSKIHLSLFENAQSTHIQQECFFFCLFFHGWFLLHVDGNDHDGQTRFLFRGGGGGATDLLRSRFRFAVAPESELLLCRAGIIQTKKNPTETK